MKEKITDAIQALGRATTQTMTELFGAQAVRAMLQSQFSHGEVMLDRTGALIVATDAGLHIKNLVAFFAGRLIQDFGYDFAEKIFRAAYLTVAKTDTGDPRFTENLLQCIPEEFLEQERVERLSKEELERRVLERTREFRDLNAKLEETISRRTKDLVAANASLRELLREMEVVGKILVRRDLELTRANARLEELDTVKSEFVSIAAHQLRTPLTGIRWSYQTILDRDAASLTRDQRRLLESGLGAAMRMIDLVNDLLSVARIEEGRFGIRLRKQSITPLLEEMTARYAAIGKEKGIKFLLVLPTGGALPDLAFDEERIGLVLDNLMDNALKYTEPGGTVAVRALREKNRVRVAVEDTGVGIPPPQIHRVFTKFFRADNAVRLHTSGTGLGLYVVKNIIDRHNGEIAVQSAEGKGSAFSFTLPVV